MNVDKTKAKRSSTVAKKPTSKQRPSTGAAANQKKGPPLRSFTPSKPILRAPSSFRSNHDNEDGDQRIDGDLAERSGGRAGLSDFVNRKKKYQSSSQTLHTQIKPEQYYPVRDVSTYTLSQRFERMDDQEEEDVKSHGSPEQVTVDRNFQQFLDRQTKLAFEEGKQKQALKSLQSALNQRKAHYEAHDERIWKISERVGDICLHFAIMTLRELDPHKAMDYLAMLRVVTEPGPGADWVSLPRWKQLRRDMSKNVALYHQSQHEWQLAFDSIRQTITYETQLGESSSNSALTAAILLSKMSRFAEAIEYCQQCTGQVEKSLGLEKRAHALIQLKYKGDNKGLMESREKDLTTYAIANHLLAKSLISLNYFREAKVFLGKASTIVNKVLNSRKHDLQAAIMNDIAQLGRAMRTYAKSKEEPSAADIERTLTSIRTDLLTQATQEGVRLVQETRPQGKNDKSKPRLEEGIAPHDEAKQDFILQSMINANSAEVNIAVDPSRPTEQPSAEQEPSPRAKKALAGYIKYLEKSKEELQLDFINQRKVVRDKEAIEAEEGAKFIAKPLSNKQKLDARRKEGQTRPNVKTAEFNLAKMGAKQDLRGVKYSHEKSVKKYLGTQKAKIVNANLSEDEIQRENSMQQQERRGSTLSLPPLDKQHGRPIETKEETTTNLLKRLKEKKAQLEREEILSEKSNLFSEEKGPIDTYSDEFADDLITKLHKQTRDIRGEVEEDSRLEDRPQITQTSSVPKLPPVIHNESDASQSKVIDVAVVPQSAKAAHSKKPSILKAPSKGTLMQSPSSRSNKNNKVSILGSERSAVRLPLINAQAKSKKSSRKSSSPSKISAGSPLDTSTRQRTPRTKEEAKQDRQVQRDRRIGRQPSLQQHRQQASFGVIKNLKERNVSAGSRASMVSQLKRELLRPKRDNKDFLTIGPVKKSRYGLSSRLQQLSAPTKKLEKKELTVEDQIKEQEKIELLEERKNKYKKFDFAAFVNRDEEFVIPDKTKATNTTKSQSTRVATERMMAESMDQVEKLEPARYKPPIKGGRAPRQLRQGSDSQADLLMVKNQSTAGGSPTRTSQQSPGLRSTQNITSMNFAEKAARAQHSGFSIAHLRELEHAAAIKVQSLVRQSLTRKWFLNFIVRKRLSMPFSGLDFTQSPFLRQFNRVNTNLHITSGPSSIAHIVQEQGQNRGMVQLKVKTKLGVSATSSAHQPASGLLVKKPKGAKIDLLKRQKISQRTFKVSKGMKADELLTALRDDFIDHGMDAYKQFRRMGVGLDLSEADAAYNKSSENGHRQAILAMQREERDKEGGGKNNRVSKWVGFNDADCNDPSRVPIDESDSYKKHVEAKQSTKMMSHLAKPHAGENTTEQMRTLLIRMEDEVPDGSDAEEMDKGEDEDNAAQLGQTDQFKTQAYLDEEAKEIIAKKNKFFGKEVVDKFKELSREPIVFIKGLGTDSPIQWTTIVGDAYIDLVVNQVFIPIKIIGQPLKSRSLVVCYKMNLELLVIEDETKRYENLETIWPVILYLFNNWVRHQFLLLQIQSVMPEIASNLEDYTPAALAEVAKDLQDRQGVRVDGAQLLKEAQEGDEEDHDALNFSSELEIDDRFEEAEAQLNEAETNVIDRSRPEHLRRPAKAVKKENRNRVFESYQDILAREASEQEKNRRFVKFDRTVNLLKRKSMAQIKNIYQEKFQTQQKVLNILHRAELYRAVIGTQGLAPPARLGAEPIFDKFSLFLDTQTVSLPRDKSKQVQLLRAMKQSVYSMLEKQGGLSKLHIAFMNEHRRKKKALPPLTEIDYNCMDRASLKLKLVLDTLALERGINGMKLKPRNMTEIRRYRDYDEKRRIHYYDILTTPGYLSIRLMLMWGPHVEMDPKINPKSIMVMKSGPSVQTKSMAQQRKENVEKVRVSRMKFSGIAADSDTLFNVGVPAGTGLIGQSPQVMKHEPYTQQQKTITSPIKSSLKSSSNVIKTAISPKKRNTSVMFDMDKEMLDNQEPMPVIQPVNRMTSQMLYDNLKIDEIEEDGDSASISATSSIIKLKQVLEEGDGRGKRVLYNENAKNFAEEEEKPMEVDPLQSEIDQKKAEVEREVLLEKQEIDSILSDRTLLEQGCFRFDHRVFVLNLFYRRIESNVQNVEILLAERDNKYKDVAADKDEKLKVPKTYQLMAKRKRREYRLQSRPCNIVSSHPLVEEKDREIEKKMNDPNFMLDINVERTKLQTTKYQSYGEIKVFTRLSSSIWDDSINIPWESLETFFHFFGHSFDTLNFLKRQKFTNRESFIFYNLIGECLTLDPLKQVELHFDLNLLSTTRILYDNIYLQLEKHYHEQRRSRLHFYYPDILNNLKTQIEPNLQADANQLQTFYAGSLNYQHFSLKAVWAYHPTKDPRFSPSDFDKLTFPFLQNVTNIQRQSYQNTFVKLYKRQENLVQEGDLVNSRPLQLQCELGEDFREGEKPEVLADEQTQELMADPNSLFNLTLTTYPKQQTVYLGRLQLQSEQQSSNRQRRSVQHFDAKSVRRDPNFQFETSSQLLAKPHLKKLQIKQANANSGMHRSAAKIRVDPYEGAGAGSHPHSDLFNVRIEYLFRANTPLLEIKAWYCLTSEAVFCRVVNKDQIKAVIRICGQSEQLMVVSQLQALLSISQGLHGKRLYVNLNKLSDKLTQGVQDLYTMLVFNEAILVKRIGQHNISKFQQVIHLSSIVDNQVVKQKMRAVVLQFEIETELLKHHGEMMMKIVHGNKHLTQQQLAEARERIVMRSLELDPDQKLKEQLKVHIWKIKLFRMASCETYESILTQADLEEYFETEVFKFFADNPQIQRPSLMDLLKEYLTNLYMLRTQVGVTVAWNLPQFKKPLDKNGNHIELPQDQLFRLKSLNIYQKIRQVLALNKKEKEEQRRLPLSLDKLRAEKREDKVPSLGLRARLVIEKVLPIYESDDFKALKITSTQHRIITQRTKLFRNLSQFHFALVTVTHHEAMECWIWQIYIPGTQRTFISTFYASDLFNMNQQLFSDIEKERKRLRPLERNQRPHSEEELLWKKLIQISDLQVNKLGDVFLKVDSFQEPIKELLMQSYQYSPNVSDIFYLEVTIKSYTNYVTDAKGPYPSISQADVRGKEQNILIKAFSLARQSWLKDSQPLNEVLRLLQRDNLLHKDVRNLYQSMLRNAAYLLAFKLIFQAGMQDGLNKSVLAQNKKQTQKFEVADILAKSKQKQDPIPTAEHPKVVKSNTDWLNMIQLNRVLYQTVVSESPKQVATISFNESKDRFLYRLYRPHDCTTLEKRFDSSEIQKSCAPHFVHMLRNNMETQLGQRICEFYHASMLVASVLENNQMNTLTKGYKALNGDLNILSTYAAANHAAK